MNTYGLTGAEHCLSIKRTLELKTDFMASTVGDIFTCKFLQPFLKAHAVPASVPSHFSYLWSIFFFFCLKFVFVLLIYSLFSLTCSCKLPSTLGSCLWQSLDLRSHRHSTPVTVRYWCKISGTCPTP